MGLHNLPANYDAWRLSGPEDYEPKRRVTSAEFGQSYELAELYDVPADCQFSVSDGDCVKLESVTIQRKTFTAETIREWLGTAQIDRLEAEAQIWWLETGWAEAEQDYEDGLADYRRDRFYDH